MIRQCAWCKKILGEIAPLRDLSVTHGMCEKCERELLKDVKAMKEIRKAS